MTDRLYELSPEGVVDVAGPLEATMPVLGAKCEITASAVERYPRGRVRVVPSLIDTSPSRKHVPLLRDVAMFKREFVATLGAGVGIGDLGMAVSLPGGDLVVSASLAGGGTGFARTSPDGRTEWAIRAKQHSFLVAQAGRNLLVGDRLLVSALTGRRLARLALPVTSIRADGSEGLAISPDRRTLHLMSGPSLSRISHSMNVGEPILMATFASDLWYNS